VTAGDATKARTPEQVQAESGLAATLAFSNTLSSQAGQVDRLVDSTISQVATWQALAVILVVALAVALLGAVAVAGVVALRVTRRQPAAPVYVIQAPQVGAPAAYQVLDDPDQWPELRARRRALAELAAPRREGREGDGA
jgi:hypothetical protein